MERKTWKRKKTIVLKSSNVFEITADKTEFLHLVWNVIHLKKIICGLSNPPAIVKRQPSVLLYECAILCEDGYSSYCIAPARPIKVNK